MQIYDQIIEITNTRTGNITRFSPIASESCMHPGVLRVTPIECTESNGTITYALPSQSLSIPLKEQTSGIWKISTSPYTPELPKRKAANGCTPCTNCGHCSW